MCGYSFYARYKHLVQLETYRVDQMPAAAIKLRPSSMFPMHFGKFDSGNL